MTTIASSLPATTYSYAIASTSSSASVGTTVATTSDLGLTTTAVNLAAEASVVATLGGNASASPLYDAAGLLNKLTQAGSESAQTTSSDSTTKASQTSQQSSDESVDASLIDSVSPASSSSSTTALYTAGGSLQTTAATDLSSNWASILKDDPQYATTATADAMNQGIVATLSTSA